MRVSKVIMIVGALLLLSLFVVPLWQITLSAPQYPEPIGMNIWITKIADMNPNDVNNINIMNHYVGMKEIPEHMAEFDIFPWVVGGMAILGVIFGPLLDQVGEWIGIVGYFVGGLVTLIGLVITLRGLTSLRKKE